MLFSLCVYFDFKCQRVYVFDIIFILVTTTSDKSKLCTFKTRLSVYLSFIYITIYILQCSHPAMPSQSELTDNEALSPLPPVISNNLRVKLEAEQISLTQVIAHKEKHLDEQSPSIYSVISTDPFFPHVIAWNPKNLHFEIENNIVVRKLRVCNASARLIYLQCGRFSNDVGRLGASWCCLRRTRFLLAPGIVAVIYIKATPRDYSPISSANISLQLAAAYMRDNVVALYEVPIFIKFLKYIPPCAEEDA